MKLATLLACVFLATWGSAQAAEPLALALELGKSGIAQRIEVETETTEFHFFVVAEAKTTDLSGTLMQTGGGLLIPAKDSKLQCDRICAEKTAILWKINVHLPQKKSPAGYAIVFKENCDGRLLTRGLILLQVVERKSNSQTRKSPGMEKNYSSEIPMEP